MAVGGNKINLHAKRKMLFDLVTNRSSLLKDKPKKCFSKLKNKRINIDLL